MSRNKIDEAKLRSLGVPEEVIESMDIREDGKCVINQDKCMGCGWCKLECRSGALRTQQTFPMRSSVNEYFMRNDAFKRRNKARYCRQNI